MRQEEGIGVPDVQREIAVARHQRLQALWTGRVPRVGVAHHALGHGLGVDAGPVRQRALHQQLADAHSEPPANQLHQQKAPLGVQHVQSFAQAQRLLGGRQPLHGQQPLFHPVGQALPAVSRWGRQHVRDGLGQVTHSLVALLEEPFVNAGHRAGRLPQQRGRHHLAGLAPGQEVHRPGGVLGRRVLKVGHHGRHLGRGGRAGVQRLVQVGKAAHGRMMPADFRPRQQPAVRPAPPRPPAWPASPA